MREELLEENVEETAVEVTNYGLAEGQAVVRVLG